MNRCRGRAGRASREVAARPPRCLNANARVHPVIFVRDRAKSLKPLPRLPLLLINRSKATESATRTHNEKENARDLVGPGRLALRIESLFQRGGLPLEADTQAVHETAVV